jgi:phenylalanyl-tRNA synthetase alpha chain
MEKETTKGSLHPLSSIILEIERIFNKMGFDIASGPEVETEFYNFDALNIPKHHPARDMWDTIWLNQEDGVRKLLRTHTSPVQIRHLEKNGVPVRIISPGKVFRHEATDATHEAQFFQFEGLMIDEKTSLSTLTTVLKKFFSEFLGKKLNVRLRPGYFPFVEPGVEVDVECFKCNEEGEVSDSCNICRGSGWIEILGGGMVHPNVLSSVGIDPEKYQGFAFGGGIDRLAMLRYGVPDVRLFYQGDLRLVKQF